MWLGEYAALPLDHPVGRPETAVFDLASHTKAARWPHRNAYTIGYTAFSPDGAHLIPQSALEDLTLRRTGTWETVLTLKSPVEEQFTLPVFSPHGRWLAAAGARGEIYLWDLPALAAVLTDLGLARK